MRSGAWAARLLDLACSSVDYRPVASSERDPAIMAAIDEIHTELPFYGIRRIRNELRDRGFRVGRQHVTSLMRRMGTTAIAPKRRLSKPAPGDKIYPYPLRGVEITEAGHVWSADITYLPLARGFCYLTAIMDWASRRVLSWRLSTTLDASFCIEALEEALERYDAPMIFNTDQGSQFTSEGFTSVLLDHGVQVSVDGRGRWMDNVFIERLWRSVKHEEVTTSSSVLIVCRAKPRGMASPLPFSRALLSAAHTGDFLPALRSLGLPEPSTVTGSSPR